MLKHHLLYITSPQQMEKIKQALLKMAAVQLSNGSPITSSFELQHRLLGAISLQIHLLSHIDGVSAHLRQNPVDLLIYDERGDEAMIAPEAIDRIRNDVKQLADLWGPDFLFPMSRVVAILEKEDGRAQRAFELGRLHVRDVCVAPKSTATILLWLKRLLMVRMTRRTKVGMCLSGGGLEGFLYQAGTLFALDQALEGRGLRKIDIVSGVSSGAIAGSMFAAEIPISEVIRALHKRSTFLPSLTSRTIFDLAGLDIARRILKESVSWAGLNPQKWINKTLRGFPTGFLKGQNLENFFHESLKRAGHDDTFEDFSTKLFIGATDQDSYEHVIFGEPPWDKVRVSEAVRASCALPPIFMPKQINGRWFIDGQVTKTTDLELVIDKGCSLVLIINPLKPHPASVPGSTDKLGGIHGIIQTIKALVSTRFAASLTHVTERYPDVDFVVFEPDEECAQAMSGSPMRYRIRTQIIQLAYQATLRNLRDRHHVYEAKFRKYGFQLKKLEEIRELEKIDTAHLEEFSENVILTGTVT